MTPELREQVLEAERRRAQRTEVQGKLRLFDRERRELHGALLNLSPAGFMAWLDAPVRERDPVRVELPPVGWVRADAVWVLGWRAGFTFREPLTPHDYLTLLGRFRQPERSSATPASRSNR